MKVRFDIKLHFIEDPIEIIDCDVEQLNQSTTLIVKVHWKPRRGPEFTWEREDQFEIAQRIPSTQILPESREILLTVTKRYDLENK
ncbi:hypothetical protein Tco_1162664 [Tanacetum coccineum]